MATTKPRPPLKNLPLAGVTMNYVALELLSAAADAMRRNRTICGLSRAMVLIEARGSVQTEAPAVDAAAHAADARQ